MVSAEVFFPGLSQHSLRANSSAAGQLFIAPINNNIHTVIASGMRPQIQQTKSELAAHALAPMEVERPSSTTTTSLEAELSLTTSHKPKLALMNIDKHIIMDTSIICKAHADRQAYYYIPRRSTYLN